jgi:hypothetical protein
MKNTKVSFILKQAHNLNDKKLARQLRKDALLLINKYAEELGILQNTKGTPVKYETKENLTTQRGGKDNGYKKYDTGPEHQKSNLKVDEVPRSLSTRYSPDRIGVQARRISDGVYQDPITNKIYDWNEGFTTEDGQDFPGGQVSLQTDLMNKK